MPVGAAAGEQKLVRVELDASHRVHVVGELLQDPAHPDLPYFYATFLAARRNPLPVRAEFDAVHTSGVAGYSKNTTY